ncbi:MAG: AAA family ATPase [Anaerovoracaceae bacterium]
MDQKIIVTIARQYGSGGRAIGKQLAQDLNIPFYDKDLIQLAAKESGIEENLFARADESPSNSFWDTFASNANLFGNKPLTINDMPMNDKLFVIQANIIKDIAEKGSCVIVGRCADYILRDVKGTTHLFIHSDEKDKLNRIINSYGVSEKDARDVMLKTDRQRSAYYNYYADNKWGRAENYDLSIKTSALGITGTVRLIKDYLAIRYGV